MSDPSHPDHPTESARPAPPQHPFAHDAAGASSVTAPRRSKRRIWFIAGTVALAFTIAVIAFSTIRMQDGAQTEVAPPPLDSATPDELDGEVPSVIWPNNMEGGGVLYRDAMQPDPADAPANDAAPVPREIDRSSGPADILIFVDYRCPACVLFEATNSKTLEEIVTGGEATLEIRPLTFLDRIDPDDAYSTRAAAAQACVVDGQPELAWATHELLLDPNFVPGAEGAGHTEEAFVHAFDEVGDGLTGDVQSCIESRTFVPFASAMNQWSFQNPVPHAEDASLVVQGTPTVLVNGVLFEGAPGDGAAFDAFLADQGLSVD